MDNHKVHEIFSNTHGDTLTCVIERNEFEHNNKLSFVGDLNTSIMYVTDKELLSIGKLINRYMEQRGIS